MKKGRLLRRRYFLAVTFLLVAVAAAAIIMQSFRTTAPAPVVVPISELLNRADHGQIREARISGDRVDAVTSDGQFITAQKEDNSPLANTLRLKGATVSVARTAGDLSAAPFLLLLPLAAVVLLFFVARGGGMSSQAFSFGRSRPRVYDDKVSDVTFDDVAGVEEAKYELSEIVQFLKSPERFTAIGARVPKGVLLVGPPGTGKTLISKAVAGEAGVPFLSVSGSEFVEMFVGVGASRVRDLFKRARKAAPCIVFIDEIDAVGRRRGQTIGGSNDEREQTLNQLLVEMDGFDSASRIIVIAATNRVDILDPALLRPGRYDRQVILDAPDVGGREAILSVHARGKPLAEGVDLRGVARQTPGFSGADLANVINEAAIQAARAARSQITMQDLDEAVLRVLAGPERKSRIITEHEKNVVAYHEVGHALVMKSLPDADPVSKVSIISRGRALGITVQRPSEDRYLVTREQLLARMAGAMGGRAAEELIFGTVTTGARQDIDVTTDIARRMVCEFGMSSLGTVALGARDDRPGTVSEVVAARIDAEVAKLVAAAYATAKEILTRRHGDLVTVSEHLKVVETIDAVELDGLLVEGAEHHLQPA